MARRLRRRRGSKRRFRRRLRRKSNRGGFSATSDGMRTHRTRRRGRRGGTVKRRFKRGQLSIVKPSIIVSESSGRAYIGPGQCRYVVLNMLRPPYDYNQMFAQRNSQTNSTGLLPLNNNFQPGTYQPYAWQPAGFQPSGGQSAQFGTSEFFVKAHARTELINGSVAPLTCWFYTLIPRQSISRWQPYVGATGTSTGLFINGSTAGSQADIGFPSLPPGEAIAEKSWQQGYSTLNRTFYDVDSAYSQFTGQSSNLNQFASLTPFDNPRFCQQFKIVQSRKICINPGKCISHVMRGHYQKFNVHRDNPYNELHGFIAYKGQPILMAKFVGPPAVDSSTIAAHTGYPQSTWDQGTVTSGSGLVNWTQYRRYEVKALFNNAKMVLPPISILATGIQAQNEAYMSMPQAGTVVAGNDS